MKSHYPMRFGGWAWLLLLAIWWPPYSAASFYPEHPYDEYFQRSTASFLTSWYDKDWRWLKAQGIAESKLDPLAVSPVGAIGVMQIMPPTWKELAKQLRFGTASPYDPAANIVAGTYYMRLMLRTFSAPRSESDRRRWAWGAYNWGIGNMLKAQKKSDNSNAWSDVRANVPPETILYVYRIELYRSMLLP